MRSCCLVRSGVEFSQLVHSLERSSISLQSIQLEASSSLKVDLNAKLWFWEVTFEEVYP